MAKGDERRRLRAVYGAWAELALGAGDRHTAGTSSTVYGAANYADAVDPSDVPAVALTTSLATGNPITAADLRQGELVVDLGCGAGLDVVLAGRRAGGAVPVIGLDAAHEMLRLARRNAAACAGRGVFLQGYVEDLPLRTGSIDVVISNGTIVLSADKAGVFREILRVLRPGGRFALADLLAASTPSRDGRSALTEWRSAITPAEYEAGLVSAGFEHVQIRVSHPVAEGIVSAVVRGRRPRLDAV
jgi:arsenite methyltransferase